MRSRMARPTPIPAVSTDSIPSGQDETLFVDFNSNDPVDPVAQVEIFLQVRSLPVLSLLVAQQTSTNGEGFVTLTTELLDPDRELCELAVSYRTNNASPWIAAPLHAASADWGVPQISTGDVTQVTNILTSIDGETVTNTLHVVWDTQRAGQAILITTNAQLTVRAWDGLFWSDSVTSMPFLVDNEAPPPPESISYLSHSAQSWSTQALVQIDWSATDDGIGVGIDTYTPQIRDGSMVLTGAQTVVFSETFMVPYDGTNWLAGITAVDAYGNQSALREADGPLWIDTQAPSGSQVVISFVGSASGDYTVGPSTHVSWTPFTDNLSGVAGFHYILNTNDITANAVYTTDDSVLTPLFTPNATNWFYLWPQDYAGLIGDPCVASIFALDNEGDYDGDGISNEGEELTATDATDPESLFSILSISFPVPTDVAFAWPSTTGAVYSLYSADQLSASEIVWSPVPGSTNLPGVVGIMSTTNQIDNVSNRYYRVQVEPDE